MPDFSSRSSWSGSTAPSTIGAEIAPAPAMIAVAGFARSAARSAAPTLAAKAVPAACACASVGIAVPAGKAARLSSTSLWNNPAASGEA